MRSTAGKILLLASLATVALCALPDDAEAKRRLGGSWGSSAKKAPAAADEHTRTRLPVVVPSVGLGGSSRKPPEVVKVVDLPDRAEFQRDDGTFVDLGWRFIGETNGEWVGYVGSDTNYLAIEPDQLSTILEIAALPALPDPPRRGESADQAASGGMPALVEMSFFWTVLLFAGAFAALRAYHRRSAVAEGEAVSRDDGAATWMAEAQSRLTAAEPVRAATTSLPGTPRTSTVVRGSPSTFGRRA